MTEEGDATRKEYMKALVFDGGLRLVDDRPLPEPRKGEALVRVGAAGICNTDLEITRGYMNFAGVLGHEFVGVVERENDSDQEWVGRRVVGEINCGCGKCCYCQGGQRSHCQMRTTLGISGRDGAFAEYLVLPVENLHGVPAKVRDEEAVFVEPLAAALEITEQVHVRPTDRVLVLGDGKLGLLAAAVLGLTQAEVALVGKHENKLKIARDMGVEAISLDELVTENFWDVVVEATGSTGGFMAALSLVRPRGTLVLKSTVAASGEMNLAPAVIDEVRVVGSRCGPFEPALRALSCRAVDVRPMITEIYCFERAEEAFERAMEGDALKVILDFR